MPERKVEGHRTQVKARLKLRYLIYSLRSRKSSKRSRAAEKLGQIGDKRAIPALVHILIHDHAHSVQKNAAEALKCIGDQSALDLLIPVLKDDDNNPQVRSSKALAVAVVASIGGDTAIESLVIALADEDSHVRRAAIDALGELDDSRAIEPLVSFLHSEDYWLMKNAAKALSSLGWEPADNTELALKAIANDEWDDVVRIGLPAVPRLLGLLDQSVGSVREQAVKALGTIGDTRAVEPLIALLENADYEMQSILTQALAKIGTPALRSLAVALGNPSFNIWYRARSTIIEFGQEAVEPLLQTLADDDVRPKAKVIELLSEIGDGRAVEPLIAALEDGSLQPQIIEVLGSLRDSRAVQPLLGILETGGKSTRKEAEKALSSIGWEAVSDKERALRAIALGDWDEVSRMGPPSVDLLTPLLCDLSWMWDRKKIVDTLARIGGPGVAALSDALKHESQEVRRTAVEALGQTSDPQAVEPLVNVIRDGGLLSWDARKSLESILESANEVLTADQRAISAVVLHKWDAAASVGAPAVGSLLAALQDEHTARNHFRPIVAALGKIGDTQAVGPLLAALQDESQHEDEVVISALGGLKDARAVEALIMALTDQREQVRMAAASSLGKLGDRSAIGALTVTLGDWDSRVPRQVDRYLRLIPIGPRQKRQELRSRGWPRDSMSVSAAMSAIARSVGMRSCRCWERLGTPV